MFKKLFYSNKQIFILFNMVQNNLTEICKKYTKIQLRKNSVINQHYIRYKDEDILSFSLTMRFLTTRI